MKHAKHSLSSPCFRKVHSLDTPGRGLLSRGKALAEVAVGVRLIGQAAQSGLHGSTPVEDGGGGEGGGRERREREEEEERKEGQVSAEESVNHLSALQGSARRESVPTAVGERMERAWGNTCPASGALAHANLRERTGGTERAIHLSDD